MLNYLLITDTKEKTGYELAFGFRIFHFSNERKHAFLKSSYP